MTPLTSLSLQLIGVYQRHISPYKGFSCAYRVHTGRDSCSRFAQRAVQRCGVLQGWRLLCRRFAACRAAHAALQAEAPPDPVVNEPCPLWSRQGLRRIGECSCGCWPFVL